jgi:hypothetical protein
MIVSPDGLESLTLPNTWDKRDWYECLVDECLVDECLVDECPQHYSPICGYFVVEPNDDHWQGTGASSFRINRNPKQAICVEHQDVMLLESFDSNTGVENFRCPRENCQNTMKTKVGAAPA